MDTCGKNDADRQNNNGADTGLTPRIDQERYRCLPPVRPWPRALRNRPPPSMKSRFRPIFWPRTRQLKRPKPPQTSSRELPKKSGKARSMSTGATRFSPVSRRAIYATHATPDTPYPKNPTIHASSDKTENSSRGTAPVAAEKGSASG